MRRHWLAAILTAAALVSPTIPAALATVLPLGFVETKVVGDLVSPTTTVHAGDGRIFVAEQDGRVRIVKNGVLLAEPFVQLDADNIYERGLLGITLDPSFADNGYVYVYYSAAERGGYRLSRFVDRGDLANGAQEEILVEFPAYNSGARYHFGGSMHFGADGKLYLGVGDHSMHANGQSLANPFGKMLRLNSDGTIPADNPFVGQTSGLNRAIWAYGLRNPFTFGFDPASGRMFIDDVGSAAWEEINEGMPGANYGWSTTEGPTDDPRFAGPIFAYGRSQPGTSGGCAITAGTFYSPAVEQFPEAYMGGFFFADLCRKWIRWLDPVTYEPIDFASQLAGGTTDLDVGIDGSLYYLARSTGGVRQDDEGGIYRITYTGSLAPQITVQPESQTVLVGEPATFIVEAIAADGYQWQRDGIDLPGAIESTYTLESVTAEDDGGEFRVVAANAHGTTSSAIAVLTTTTNQMPSAMIELTSPHELYHAGDTVAFRGAAVDPEDGILDASAFTWRVDFHHNTHFHPYVPPTAGVKEGEFTIATVGETAADVWYRVNLRVDDSGGRSSSTYADIHPELATFTLSTAPLDFPVSLDGQPVDTPVMVTGVVGLLRHVAAEPSHVVDSVAYAFDHWSDGGEIEHTISVPPGATTYTAVYLGLPTTTSTSTTISQLCGNGVTDDGEDCDDGDTIFVPGDYCADNCRAVACGSPTRARATSPRAADALFTLGAAIGLQTCDMRLCDVDGSGSLDAADALVILRAALGLPVELACSGRVSLLGNPADLTPCEQPAGDQRDASR